MKEEFRRITSNEKEAILKMTENIWDGEDYTKIVFDEWVENTRNPFIALWLDDELSGIGRLSWVTESDAWLEGLKKHPACEHRGVGSKFLEHFLDMIRSRDRVDSIRFSTYFPNVESIALNTRRGFYHKYSYSHLVYEISGEEKPAEGVVEIAKSKEDFLPLFINSGFNRDMKELIAFGWVFYPAAPENFQRFIEKGYILATGGGSLDGAILLIHSPKEKSMNILAIHAECSDVMDRLLTAAKHCALQRNIPRITLMAPDDAETLRRFRTNGFTSWEKENDVYLFELPLDRL